MSSSIGQLLIFFSLLGSPNTNFAQNADSFSPQVDGPVYVTLRQPGGKIIIGGIFGNVSGVPKQGIARLNPDTTLDTTFSASTDGNVFALAAQDDGKILVGGSFNSLNGHSSTNFGRLQPNGTLDTNFAVSANGLVLTLAVQSNQSIWVGGQFTQFAGQMRTNIARISAAGVVESPATVGTDFGGQRRVDTVQVLADGKVLVGGLFDRLAGVSRLNLGRLNSNDTLDNDFLPAVTGGGVYRALVQRDGRILIGGYFNFPRLYLARLLTNGLADTAFLTSVDGPVLSFTSQPDANVVVGGDFTLLGGQPRENLGRLLTNDTIDASFNPGAGGTWVLSTALQPDGKILVGGSFSTLGGQSRTNIGRISSGLALPSLAIRPGSNNTLGLTFTNSNNITYRVISSTNSSSDATWTPSGYPIETALGNWTFIVTNAGPATRFYQLQSE